MLEMDYESVCRRLKEETGGVCTEDVRTWGAQLRRGLCVPMVLRLDVLAVTTCKEYLRTLEFSTEEERQPALDKLFEGLRMLGAGFTAKRMDEDPTIPLLYACAECLKLQIRRHFELCDSLSGYYDLCLIKVQDGYLPDYTEEKLHIELLRDQMDQLEDLRYLDNYCAELGRIRDQLRSIFLRWQGVKQQLWIAVIRSWKNWLWSFFCVLVGGGLSWALSYFL